MNLPPTATDPLSRWARAQLRQQGYALCDRDADELWLGLRLTPVLFVVALFTGIFARVPALLVTVGVIWTVSSVLVIHPVDALYNALRRSVATRAPHTPLPRRFGYLFGGSWMAVMGVLFWAGLDVPAWAMAAIQLPASLTGVTTRWCVPAVVYRVAPEPLRAAVRALEATAHRLKSRARAS